jgi:multiple inositol-polyphosphate phosphatase/2,3-bisphosphoglycerate 3-phosphatase
MKKVISLLLFLIGCTLTASAQNCNADFLGTKTLYKSNNQKYTPAPIGYDPVFINHVGRHGARHLTKEVKTTLAYALLLKADSLSALTPKGKKLKQMALALQKVEKGNTKFISAEGREELKDLGERMYNNYSDVFNNKPELSVAITKEVRTKQSADAFLKGLNGKLKDSASISEYNDDTALRFYDASPAYKKFEAGIDEGDLKLSLNQLAHFEEINKAVTSRFFTADFLKGMGDEDREKFVAEIFGFATIVYSLNAEIKQAGFQLTDLDFQSFFTCDELSRLGLLDAADENLKKGPGSDNDGIQVRVAAPLLVDFINTSDEFIKTGKFNARLRFAHAETIAPFAALLQIAAADRASKDPAKLNDFWSASGVIPLSANIQWIFYKKKSSPEYLVKILLNEKEAHITGLNEKSFPYYKWNDLRALYLEKLNRLHVKLTDDIAAYLVNLE